MHKVLFVLSCIFALSVAFSVQDEMIRRHNKDRRRHGAVELKTNNDLVEVAEICAERNARRDKIAHDCPESEDYGENLSWSMNSRGSPDDETATDTAYDGWYEEHKNYNYRTGKSMGGVTGHFTQQVWNGSKELGCASAQNVRRRSTVVVCVYNPPGNYGGQYVKNVFKPSDD